MMGKVLVAMRVFPVEGQDAAELAERVKAVEGCNTSKVEDYVFGTKIVKASFVCEDGENRDFEEEVKKIAGVSEVQVDEVGLVS
ncbi:MAG: hypothetical protein AABW54_01665 [Candidatus Micrarchaeota archaeon]